MTDANADLNALTQLVNSPDPRVRRQVAENSGTISKQLDDLGPKLRQQAISKMTRKAVDSRLAAKYSSAVMGRKLLGATDVGRNLLAAMRERAEAEAKALYDSSKAGPPAMAGREYESGPPRSLESYVRSRSR